MPELNAQQAMEQTVRQAHGQLNDGAMVQGTLEHLWRLAFAAGVRVGQEARATSRLPEKWAEGISARADGWTYGIVRLSPGSQFAYGGADREKPVCKRQATVSALQFGRNWMLLNDTGERLKIPVMCWWRPVVEEESGDAERA